MKFTHNGWFGFCPVKVGDLERDPISLGPRWFWLAPLFWLAQELAKAGITLASALSSDYEPSWRIRITGERK